MLEKFSDLKFGFRAKALSGLRSNNKTVAFKSLEKEEAMKKNSSFNVLFHAHTVDASGNVKNYEYVAVTAPEFDYETFKNRYGFLPNYRIMDNYVFMMNSYVSKETYDKYSEAASYVLGGSACEGLPYPGSTLLETGETVVCEKVSDSVPDFERIWEYKKRIESQDIRASVGSRENTAAIENAMKVNPFEKTLRIMGHQVDEHGTIDGRSGWFFDEKKRQVVDVTGSSLPCGNQFHFVLLKKNGKIEETMRWFKENLGADVDVASDEVTVSTPQIASSGYLIESGEGFVLTDLGYQTTAENPRMFTDFSIRVYHKIENVDGTVDYIVSLDNRKNGSSTEKILYKHTSSSNSFKDFLSRYGNYHFFGTSSDLINKLHSSICSAPVSVVQAIVGYGFHKDKLVLSNGVFDLKTKELTLNEVRERYIFDSKGNGYLPQTPVGMSMKDAYDESSVPKFTDSPKIVSAEKQLSMIRSGYKGNAGAYLMLYVWGLLGYGMYRDKEDVNMPFLLVHGVRGSGKTEYAKFIRRIYNIKNSYNFETLSPFVLASLFSSFAGLPVFLSEYREDRQADKRLQKMSKFRSIYDKGSETKGRANQTTITYQYSSSLVIEGEEAISDSAMRSRCVTVYLTKANRSDSFKDFKEIQASDMFEHVMYSYLRKVKYDYKKYDEAFMEGAQLFEFNESRLTNTMARIYAGCVTYAPELKEEIISILNELFEIQANEFRSNDPVTKFMKKVAFNMANIFDGYAVDGNKLHINISKVEEYFRVKRVELDMGSFETYVQYCGDYGFPESMCTTEFTCFRSIMLDMDADNFPPQFMVVKEVNDYFKRKRKNENLK